MEICASFDLKLPAKCDNEYWEQGDAFQQPPTKLSLMEFFNCLITLNHILTLMLKMPMSDFHCFLILNFCFIKYSTNHSKTQ
ncbi:hypothetical protein B0H10DRAFT_1851907 [Mycena sp. CBHHK59/15]|nr:hypothetical protein B0H10DRAFT_1851907 [Mycena sp. CBHHK59/15]